MRLVIALAQHETNTFSPLPTTVHSFASGVGLDTPPSGEQALNIYGKADFAFAAFVDIARNANAEIVVPITAYAEPGGKVEDVAFELIASRICEAIAKGCDAVMLDLHGAMVTESFDDGEGELLRRIRAINADIPIAVALDFHTNLTQMMVDNATVITGYRTYPHIDMYETGQRAGKSLMRMLNQQCELRMTWSSAPMMTHMLKQTPARQPMKDIMDLAIEAEAMQKFANVSVFGGFPLADIPHVSLSALVVSEVEQNSMSAEPAHFVEQLIQMAWQRRADFVFAAEPLAQSISYAKSLQQGPIVIADHGDNTGAGGSADDMTVLQEMLRQGLTNIVAGPIWDPLAVAQLIESGEGSTITLSVGGKTSVRSIAQSGQSLLLSGVVNKITDGRFVIEGPMQTGLNVNLGRTVVLRTVAADIVISEERWEPYDTACFTHAGIDPLQKKYILIKSRQHFRATFEALAKHIVLAAGPGVCSSDYQQFRFEKLPRPIYPLELDTSFTSDAV